MTQSRLRNDAVSRRGFLAAGGAIALTGCDRSRKRFLSADTHRDGYPTVEAVKFMGQLLRERTSGRLDIQIFAGGQLGSETDALEITTFGGLDLNRVNLAALNAIEPLTAIPSLPFLFRSSEHLHRVIDGEPGRRLRESLRPHGMIGLCFYDSGERSFYNTKRPIRDPADMRGMKLRVPNSDLYVAMVKALGADATPMPLGEVYQALVQGVIDGAENNWPSYEVGRHFEAAPNYSLTRHVMAPEALVMSAIRWNKLTSADQDLVLACAQESVPYMRGLWTSEVEASRTRLLASGVRENEIEDVAAFSDLMRPVWSQFVRTAEHRKLVEDIESLVVA